MRWYFGYPVLAAGLYFAANTLFPDDSEDLTLRSAPPPSEETAAGAEPKVMSAADILAQPRSRLAAFSPGARLVVAEQAPSKPSMFDYLAQAFSASAAPRPAHADPASFRAVAQGSWKSAVVRFAPNDLAETAQPVAAEQKALLARDVQRELQRVGCYVGEIDGIWGPGSQRAVTAFMQRVNAVLPVDEPDVFMLSLLSAEAHTVCGTGCPHGQVLSAGDRCLPSTLLAHNAAPSGQGETQTFDTVAAGPVLRRGPTLAARPREAGAAKATADRAGSDAAWQVTVAEAETQTQRGAPFHGRMSIGGPTPAEALPHPPLRRTASLATDPSGTAEENAVFPVTITGDPPRVAEEAREPRPQRAAKRARPKKVSRVRKKRRRSARHVQSLFQHPLGRM